MTSSSERNAVLKACNCTVMPNGFARLEAAKQLPHQFEFNLGRGNLNTVLDRLCERIDESGRVMKRWAAHVNPYHRNDSKGARLYCEDEEDLVYLRLILDGIIEPPPKTPVIKMMKWFERTIIPQLPPNFPK